MFRLKKVCCCIPLRPGGVVLGVVSLLSALCTVAITILGIVNKHKPMRWDNGTALFDEDSVNKAQPVLWALTVLYVIVAIVAGLMIKGSIEVGPSVPLCPLNGSHPHWGLPFHSSAVVSCSCPTWCWTSWERCCSLSLSLPQ